MDEVSLLLAYSEWLDSEAHVIKDDAAPNDGRTHEELVRDFLGRA